MEKNVQNLFSFGNPLFFGVFNVKIRGVLVVCPFERLQVSQKKAVRSVFFPTFNPQDFRGDVVSFHGCFFACMNIYIHNIFFICT